MILETTKALLVCSRITSEVNRWLTPLPFLATMFLATRRAASFLFLFTFMFVFNVDVVKPRTTELFAGDALTTLVFGVANVEPFANAGTTWNT
jgi:hypothetical protein